MSSLSNAEKLLYLTYGHISGLFDQFLGEDNTDQGDFTPTTHISNILANEDRKYVFQNLLYGDIEFLEVLLEATRALSAKEHMSITGYEHLCPSSFDLENAERFVELVKKEIEKDPVKYTNDSILSRGVVQYAKALLAQIDE